jgi:4-amino-4-deoxy-L-arabinose transferase-like glycosyltransferase
MARHFGASWNALYFAPMSTDNRDQTRSTRSTGWLIAAPLVTLAILWVVVSTRDGAAVLPDSVTYIDAAKRFAAGEGLVAWHAGSIKPLTHFPPVYALVLSFLVWLGITTETAAVAINVVCFAGTAMAVFVLTSRASGSLVAGGILTLVVILNVSVLAIHAMALSEPLFLLLAAWTLVALEEAERRESSVLMLIAALLAAAAALTRYAGVVLIAYVVLRTALIDSPRRPWRTLTALGVSAAPLALWLLWTRHAGAGAANRELRLVPITVEEAARGFITVGAWLVPTAPSIVQLGAGLLMLLVLLGFAFWIARQRPRGAEWAVLLCVGYLMFVVFARLLLDPAITFRPRMLSPAVLFVAVGIAAVLPRMNRPASWGAAVIAGLAVVGSALHAPALRQIVRDIGFGGGVWQAAELPALLDNVRFAVYSNEPAALYYLAGTQAQWLPCIVPGSVGAGGIPSCDTLPQVTSDVRAGKAMVVWFDRVHDPRPLFGFGRSAGREVVQWRPGVLVVR